MCGKKKCGALDHNIDFEFERLCSVLVRLVGSLEENLLPRLQEAQQFLATLDRDDYFNCTSYAPPVIKTGIRGRPKFYIPREQLKYFIEYGFKATYIFKMLYVWVLQSSIRQFNLSHMHNILKMSVALKHIFNKVFKLFSWTSSFGRPLLPVLNTGGA